MPTLTPRAARRLSVAIVVVGLVAAVTATRVDDPEDVLGDGARPRLAPAAEAPLAPELAGITDYADGEPFTLQDLRGKVVLLDFWTYTCINCLRTFPELRALQEAYGDAGLQVVGVHSPEFAFERDHGNVVEAVRDLDVTWPVAEDTGLATFSAYGNQFWPTKYLLDREGRIRYLSVGEGGAEQTEASVRALLAEGGDVPDERAATPPDPSVARAITPETYFGGRAPDQFGGGAPVPRDGSVTTRDDPEQARDVLRLTGRFTSDGESLTLLEGASVRQALRAREAYVTASGTGQVLDVTLDGSPVPLAQRGPDLEVVDGRTVVRLDGSRLFMLLTGPQVRLGTLGLTARDGGASLFTLTYGG